MSNELLTKSLAQVSRLEREVTAEVVEHIREFMTRRLSLEHGYTSMFSYLVEKLSYAKSTVEIDLRKWNERFAISRGDENVGDKNIAVRGSNPNLNLESAALSSDPHLNLEPAVQILCGVHNRMKYRIGLSKRAVIGTN